MWLFKHQAWEWSLFENKSALPLSLLSKTIEDLAKLCRRDEAVVVLVKVVEGLLDRRDLVT